MKLSKCVIITKESDNNYLAACTLTKAIIRLNSIAKEDLESGDSENLSYLSKKDFDNCIDMGFLVPKELNENEYIGYILNKDRLNPISFNTYIAFSTSCNFKCVYCYESGQMSNDTMTTKTINTMIQWYKIKLLQGKFEYCTIDLYGGEPLLCIDNIIYFLKNLKDEIANIDTKIRIRLITNGYLLDENIISSLLAYGLFEIHVTIEGTSETHNKRRPLKNGNGTFDRVFSNLIKVSLGNFPIELTCRIGFDRSNIDNIPYLLDMLKSKDKHNLIKPYFAPITQTTSQISDSDSFCSRNVLKDLELADNIIFLYKEAKKRNFYLPDFFSLGPCMAVADEACAITPDGTIYKCLDMIGCKNLSVGNIYTNKYNPLYYSFMKATALEKCLNTDCPFIPICGGGCIMESYLSHGDYRLTNCRREMLNKIYNGLLPVVFSY